MIKVYDLGLAAYMRVVKELPYSKQPEKIPQKNFFRFNFFFEVSKAEFASIRDEYLKSAFKQFDEEVKNLKKRLNS